MNRKAMYDLSYGVFVLATRAGDRKNACITNTCIQVANDPTRIAIAVINKNYTCDLIKESGVSLVDVRTAEEYSEGHISGAINIDFRQKDFMEKAKSLLDKSKKIAVYCRSGRRSASAASLSSVSQASTLVHAAQLTMTSTLFSLTMARTASMSVMSRCVVSRPSASVTSVKM